MSAAAHATATHSATTHPSAATTTAVAEGELGWGEKDRERNGEGAKEC